MDEQVESNINNYTIDRYIYDVEIPELSSQLEQKEALQLDQAGSPIPYFNVYKERSCEFPHSQPSEEIIIKEEPSNYNIESQIEPQTEQEKVIEVIEVEP